MYNTVGCIAILYDMLCRTIYFEWYLGLLFYQSVLQHLAKVLYIPFCIDNTINKYGLVTIIYICEIKVCIINIWTCSLLPNIIKETTAHINRD